MGWKREREHDHNGETRVLQQLAEGEFQIVHGANRGQGFGSLIAHRLHGIDARRISRRLLLVSERAQRVNVSRPARGHITGKRCNHDHHHHGQCKRQRVIRRQPE